MGNRSPREGLLYGWRSVSRLRDDVPDVTAYMRQRGDVDERFGLSASWTSIHDMSPYVVCAVVGAEDPAFFEHHGIWWSQVGRMALAGVLARRRVRAVSTITQQLARNIYLHGRRAMSRKIAEALLAARMERTLTKARILELYLNVVEWGEHVWGVHAAAHAHFGIDARALNPLQSVVLASLLPAPRAPLAGKNLERAARSQRQLLHFLYASGVISTAEERETAERIAALHRWLADGVPAAEAFRAVACVPYAAASSHEGPPSVAHLLESRCALEMRIAYTTLLHGPVPAEQWHGRRPMWWNGALSTVSISSR